MDERRATEAFSLALATEHLRKTGILRHGLVMPIDLHQDIFREGQQAGVVASLSRTDLMVVQFDPAKRRVGIHLVEVKVRSTLAAEAETPDALVSEMTDQLENTETVLLDRLFGLPLRKTSRSLPGALQVRRLSVFLRHYLERSARHGWIPDDEIDATRRFIESLDHGFHIGVSLHGLVFHTRGNEERIEEHGRLRVSMLGSRYIERLLSDEWELETKIAGNSTDDYAKTAFGVPTEWIEVETDGDAYSIEKEAPSSTMKGVAPFASGAGVPSTPNTEPDESPTLEEVELLGISEKRPHRFGIIGAMSSTDKPVAINLDPNVISVFGVQGSGKSYTVGTIIEAALIPCPGLHNLDIPLGVAVFHYSDSPTYLPEIHIDDVSEHRARIRGTASEPGTVATRRRRCRDRGATSDA